MKTKQIYYIAALAMLTACTNDEEYETVTNNGLQKVTFADPFVGKNLTRASGDISTDGTISYFPFTKNLLYLLYDILYLCIKNSYF